MPRGTDEEIAAAWKAFDDVPDDGDVSWADDLPETPDLPTEPGDVVATFWPTKPVASGPHTLADTPHPLTPEERSAASAKAWESRKRAVRRVGVTTGAKAEYRVFVDDVAVGRVNRQRTLDPMVGGPRSYHISWLARRGPYDNGMAFQTPEEAEKFLVDWHEKHHS